MAVVDSAPASEPLWGSVKQKDPNFFPLNRSGKYFCFCLSLPNIEIGAAHKEQCAATESVVEPHACAISSIIKTDETVSRSPHPYFDGHGMPREPSSPILCNFSAGNSMVTSMCAARGASSS